MERVVDGAVAGVVLDDESMGAQEVVVEGTKVTKAAVPTSVTSVMANQAGAAAAVMMTVGGSLPVAAVRVEGATSLVLTEAVKGAAETQATDRVTVTMTAQATAQLASQMTTLLMM